MEKPTHKQYYSTARRGIKGEAFFEFVIVEHAIPHRIARQNDLGVDFLCEWTSGDRPIGLLFSVQVKSTTTAEVKATHSGTCPRNFLEEYTLSGIDKIDDRTIDYWKSLGFPAYLFVVVEEITPAGGDLACYYKRYTPMLDGKTSDYDLVGTQAFFKVNQGSSFRAFADPHQQVGGFARDLIIDYARVSYSKGNIVPLTPDKLGFWPFADKTAPQAVKVFEEIVGWHKKRIQETCDWTQDQLAQLPPG